MSGSSTNYTVRGEWEEWQWHNDNHRPLVFCSYLLVYLPDPTSSPIKYPHHLCLDSSHRLFPLLGRLPPVCHSPAFNAYLLFPQKTPVRYHLCRNTMLGPQIRLRLQEGTADTSADSLPEPRQEPELSRHPFNLVK